jgi:hypothetical protein
MLQLTAPRNSLTCNSAKAYVSTKLPRTEDALEAVSSVTCFFKEQIKHSPSHVGAAIEAVQTLSIEGLSDKADEVKKTIYDKYEAVGDRYDAWMNTFSHFWKG